MTKSRKSPRIASAPNWLQAVRALRTNPLSDLAAAAPHRLGALRLELDREKAAPAARSLALAEVQRFLADPRGYRPAVATAVPDGRGLWGAHIATALIAQAQAFNAEHADAAQQMRSAAALLPGPRDHMRGERGRNLLLRALLRSFIAGEAGSTPEPDRPMDEPPLFYLEQQRAERLAGSGDYLQALDALERGIAFAGPASTEARDGMAVQVAQLALKAASKGHEHALALLDIAEKRHLRPTDGHDRRGETNRRNLLYWRGQIALAQAGVSREPDASRNAANRAIEHLNQACALDQAETSKAQEGVDNFLDATRLALEEAQLQLAEHGSWQEAEAALRAESGANAALATRIAGRCATKRAAVLPQTTPQRIVLELSATLLQDDPDAEALIGEGGIEPRDDDAVRPSIGALRRLLWQRFGVTLPGVSVRSIEPEGDTSVMLALVDGAPIGERTQVTAADAWDFQDRDAPWLDAQPVQRRKGEVSPDPGLDAADYAVWLFGQRVVQVLPRLADREQMQTLGLADLRPEAILPLLRLLLADRTALADYEEALRPLAEAVAAGAKDALTAAAAFRDLPGVRTELWGLRGKWEDRELAEEQEAELEARLTTARSAVTIPRPLANSVFELARRRGSLPGMKPDPLGIPRAQSLRPRIVVRSRILRPWLRALLSREDVPVVTRAERDAVA